VIEKLHQLKGAGYALGSHHMGRLSLDNAPPVENPARIGGQKTRDQIEKGGLPGTVGADDGLDDA